MKLPRVDPFQQKRQALAEKWSDAQVSVLDVIRRTYPAAGPQDISKMLAKKKE